MQVQKGPITERPDLRKSASLRTAGLARLHGHQGQLEVPPQPQEALSQKVIDCKKADKNEQTVRIFG